MKPEKEQLSVTSILRTKEGMKIAYGMYVNNIFVSSNEKKDLFPVDEFITSLNSLKKYVAKIINYGTLNNIIGDQKFKITEEQSRYLMRLYNDLMSKISINGIDLFGTSEIIEKCVIKFSLTGYSGQNMDCKTYKIDLNGTFHGFEEELQAACDDLKDHSYEYLFENKGAVGELYSEDDEGEKYEEDQEESEEEDHEENESDK